MNLSGLTAVTTAAEMKAWLSANCLSPISPVMTGTDLGIIMQKVMDVTEAESVGVLNGTSDPGSGIGIDGDFYINTSTSMLFGPKVSGSWPAGVSLVGAAGATGPGVPTGGAAGQVLAKIDGTNYNSHWIDPNYVPLAGGTMTGFLTLSGNPTSAMHAATKNYVDNYIAGLQFIDAAAKVASPKGTNISISSAPASLDGITGVAGDRWLLKDQTNGAENGVYIFNGAGSALTRAVDAATGTQLASKTIPVSQGATQADTWWTVTNDVITIGTTNLTIVQTAGAGTYAAGTGLTLSGNLFSLDSSYTNSLYPSLSGAYANPSWISSLAWSKITGAPSFITLASLSGAAPITYNNTTGTIGITQATTSTSGYLSPADWNTFNNKQPAGNYITALTGDGTASGPGSAAFTLATVNSSPGTFGDASHSLSATVNAKGLITALSTDSIQVAQSQVTGLTTSLAGKQSTITFTNGLTSGTGITNVGLGGALTAATNINQSGFDLTFGNPGAPLFKFYGSNAWFQVQNGIQTGQGLFYSNSTAPTAAALANPAAGIEIRGTYGFLPTRVSTLNLLFPQFAPLSVDITNAGTGYTSTPTVTFSGGGAITQATGVAVLNGAGGIERIDMTSWGVGYTSLPTVTITGGGATTNATASVYGIPTGLMYYNMTTDRLTVRVNSAATYRSLAYTSDVANPTASIGLTAVNGTANTFMRSDAAPAINQSIMPTWTSLHNFNSGLQANNIGMGVSPIVGIPITIGGTSTTAAIQSTGIINNGASAAYGYFANNVIASSQTGSVFGFRSTMSTQASAAVGSVVGFSVDGVTFGSGGSATNQYGVFVQSSLTTATNNYGFYGNISNGTGRYNLYMAGDALNFLAGNLSIGGTPINWAAINIQKTIASTSASAHHVLAQGTYDSSTTNGAACFYATPNTAAASYNLTSSYGFRFDGTTLGAGSSVTAQYGFFAHATMTQGAQNYGFYGNIPAGATNFNLYMPGAAMNYLAGNLGVGIAPGTNTGIGIGATLTGSTGGYGVDSRPVLPSSLTATYCGFRSFPSTAAAAFNVTNIIHYYAVGATLGAGSSISAQYAFYAESSNNNASANYGFYGNLSSGTGRYNLYMAGTALNYMNGNLGIGVLPVAHAGLLINPTLGSSGAASYGMLVQPTIPSASTGAYVGYYSSPTTAAASFTLASLTHYEVDGSTLGSGSAVTTQYGFLVSANLVQGTNNYGFYGNIAAATGRWNLYMAGTALNYFAGRALFGTTTDDGVSQLQVNGTVSAKHLKGGSGTPTIVAGPAAGTAPTISIIGSDLAGEIIITIGTSPAAGGANLATITFNTPYAAAPRAIVLSPSNFASVASPGKGVFVPGNGSVGSPTATTFTLVGDVTALSTGSQYTWSYIVIQ